ncbi:hypothetical protein SRHO_G00111340 [Serrasalmus rhombeus]
MFLMEKQVISDFTRVLKLKVHERSLTTQTQMDVAAESGRSSTGLRQSRGSPQEVQGLKYQQTPAGPPHNFLSLAC